MDASSQDTMTAVLVEMGFSDRTLNQRLLRKHGFNLLDVVNELVGLCTNPSPSNPFALDVRYVQNLPLPERFLVSGALLNFLETYVVHGNKDELHYDRGEALVEHRGVNSSAVLLPAGGASELRHNVQFVFLVIQCITQLK